MYQTGELVYASRSLRHARDGLLRAISGLISVDEFSMERANQCDAINEVLQLCCETIDLLDEIVGERK